MQHQSLQILVGPIASGKSTYAKNAAKSRGAIIVNDDAIVKMVHGGEYQLYNSALKPLYKTVETTIIAAALTTRWNVVVDRPNYKRDTRRRYISLAHAFDMPAVIVLFPWEDPVVHAQRRVAHDGRGYDVEYWEAVARRHAAEYEPPDQKSEGFDQLINWQHEWGHWRN